jgi:hypothetical protein
LVGSRLFEPHDALIAFCYPRGGAQRHLRVTEEPTRISCPQPTERAARARSPDSDVIEVVANPLPLERLACTGEVRLESARATRRRR